MRALSSEDIVSMWEDAGALQPLDRGLALLARAGAAGPGDDLAAMSLGSRDLSLLRLRQASFGDALHLLATCPGCGERIELEVACTQLIEAGAVERESDVLDLQCDGYNLQLRLPNSYDIAAIVRLTDVDDAYETLLSRCVVSVTSAGEKVSLADLPASVRGAIAAALVEADPGAEFLLDLTCPQCAHAWQACLEIGSVLSTEVATTARRLLLEVHQLASAYGWREPDVLALSPARRAAYLEMGAQ